MKLTNMNIILASASPRRKELLERIGLQFNIVPAKGEEVLRTTIPGEAVKQLSYDKAMEVAKDYMGDYIVIGADTVVVASGKILGKPKDREDAFCMITSLKAHTHSVYTGVTLVINSSKGIVTKSFTCETKVSVYYMTDEEINEYLDCNESMDKAGAYGIQGCFSEYIYSIEGDYNNVVGLPVARLMKEMKELIREAQL